MKKQIISSVALAAIVMSSNSAFAAEEAMMKSDDTMMMQHDMNIVDVTDGKEIRGITTSPDAAGYAFASYSDGEYSLHGKFSGLTDPIGDDFYEGWVVRQSPFAFWSTGKLIKKEDGNYHNSITSSRDYSDYDFYVLTLEPNDGDAAPADHILEGDVMSAMMMKDGESMMKKEDGMMMEKHDAMMMKKELTPAQKAIRTGIKGKLAKVDTSKINLEKVLEKISNVRENIDERGFSDEKKEKYLELLDALEDVLIEILTMKSEMMDDAMMEK